jgi:hypothetical protein
LVTNHWLAFWRVALLIWITNMDNNDGSSIHVNLFGIICSTLCSVGALSGQLQSVPGSVFQLWRHHQARAGTKQNICNGVKWCTVCRKGSDLQVSTHQRARQSLQSGRGFKWWTVARSSYSCRGPVFSAINLRINNTLSYVPICVYYSPSSTIFYFIPPPPSLSHSSLRLILLALRRDLARYHNP